MPSVPTRGQGRWQRAAPWVPIAVLVVVVALAPLISLPVGVAIAVVAHLTGRQNVRNTAGLIVVVVALLLLLFGSGGAVEGGLSG